MLTKGTNLAVLLTALLLTVTILRDHWLDNKPRAPTVSGPRKGNADGIDRGSLIGKTLSLEGIHWNDAPISLVMAISSKCGYCTRSMPLYRRIVDRAASGPIQLVAVLPQSPREAREYLRDNGVNISQVVSADLDSLGVEGTPTLVAVDKMGVVVRMWPGMLDQDSEDAFFSVLNSFQ